MCHCINEKTQLKKKKNLNGSALCELTILLLDAMGSDRKSQCQVQATPMGLWPDSQRSSQKDIGHCYRSNPIANDTTHPGHRMQKLEMSWKPPPWYRATTELKGTRQAAGSEEFSSLYWWWTLCYSSDLTDQMCPLVQQCQEHSGVNQHRLSWICGPLYRRKGMPETV